MTGIIGRTCGIAHTRSDADIQMSFPLEAAAERANLDISRPKLMEWLDRIHARPAYQSAIKRSIEVESTLAT